MKHKYNYVIKNISWDTIKKLTEKIIVSIRKNNYQPEVIIPILRGGMPLALMLSQKLNIRCFETIQIVKSENDQINSVFGKAKIVNHTDMKLISGKNVLITEDVIDTLDTLTTAIHFIKKYNPKKILVSTLIDFSKDKNYKIISGRDYLKQKYWIVFPWD